MFKTISIFLISLLGCEYSTKANNAIVLNNDDPIYYNVYGGIDYTLLDNFSGFIFPTANDDFAFETNDAQYPSLIYSYNYRLDFKCDYLYFQYVNNQGKFLYDSRIDDLDFDFEYYSFSIVFNETYRAFMTLNFLNSNYQLLDYRTFYDYSYDSVNDLNGLERLFNNRDSYCFYVSNMEIERFTFGRFSYNGNIINGKNYSNNVPLEIDERYINVDRYFTFGDMIATYGYWYLSNDKFYAPYQLVNILNTIQRVPIFKGLFRSFGTLFTEYDLSLISVQQPNSGGWYYGQYGISSLSDCERPSSGSILTNITDGAYRQLQDGLYRSVWQTLTTPITSSGTTYNVISNSKQWLNDDFKTMYIYYQVNELSNDTYITGRTYYEMLTYNVGYTSITGGSTFDTLTNVFSILGIAFASLWGIGQMSLLGNITLNTLIVLPLIISLIIFVIHLIKKG